MIERFGATAVPWTVSWSGEESFFVDRCPFARMPAIRQITAPRTGKPVFGKPHWDRQRKCIALRLCDLCGRSLASSTKVSLSHARPVAHGARGLAILQVEPLLHRACAAESMRYCPSLKRDIADGSLQIRQVTRHAVQFVIMGPQFIGHYVPGYVARPDERIVGAAKVELLAWVDRDQRWLSLD